MSRDLYEYQICQFSILSFILDRITKSKRAICTLCALNIGLLNNMSKLRYLCFSAITFTDELCSKELWNIVFNMAQSHKIHSDFVPLEIPRENRLFVLFNLRFYDVFKILCKEEQKYLALCPLKRKHFGK